MLRVGAITPGPPHQNTPKVILFKGPQKNNYQLKSYETKEHSK